MAAQARQLAASATAREKSHVEITASVIEDTLIVAHLRAGHGDKAASRISVHLNRRPSARDEARSRETPRGLTS